MAAPLTQERLREVLRYYPHTGAWRWRVRMGRKMPGSWAGTINGTGRRIIGIDGKSYIAARLAILYVTGSWLFSLQQFPVHRRPRRNPERPCSSLLSRERNLRG